MPEDQIPIASEYKGLQRRVAPNLLPPGYSPDCMNCRPYNGMLGRLGPRKGRTKTSATPFAGAVYGLHVYRNHLFVGVDDGVTMTITPDLPLYNGGSPYTGPTFVTINKGFHYEWIGPTFVGTDSVFPNVPVNGANSVIVTCPSITWATQGLITVEVAFDGGGYQTATLLSAAYSSGCCGDLLEVNEDAAVVDCTGALLLSAIKVTSSLDDGDRQFSGTLHAMGCFL